MTRAFSAAILLLAGFSSLGSAEPKAPKEKPAPARATAEAAEVTFVYQRRKITQCKLATVDGEKVCEAANHTDEAGNSEVKLKPVDRRGKDDVQRQPVEFQFPKTAGRREHVVQLKGGRWELSWKDSDGIARDRFFVVAQDKFEVVLETTNGQCEEERNKCTLHGAKLKQSIELPKERGYQ